MVDWNFRSAQFISMSDFDMNHHLSDIAIKPTPKGVAQDSNLQAALDMTLSLPLFMSSPNTVPEPVWYIPYRWQRWLDLNQRMRESKSLALPLGDVSIYYNGLKYLNKLY